MFCMMNKRKKTATQNTLLAVLHHTHNHPNRKDAPNSMIDLSLAPLDMNIDRHGPGRTRKLVDEGADRESAAAPASTTATAAATARPKEVDLGDDFEPYPDSVLVGRDKSSKTAEGNQRLRAIAITMLPIYSNATKKEMKSEIVTQIVERIRTTCPRRDGAFIKQKEGRWYGVPDSVAREKVGYCIRDLLSSKYRSSSASKNERRRKKIQAEQQQVEREVKARLKQQKEVIPVGQREGAMLQQQQQQPQLPGQGIPSDFTQQEQQIRGNIDALTQLLRQQQQRPQQVSDFARMAAAASSAAGSGSPHAPSSNSLAAPNLPPSLGLPGSMSQLPPAAAMFLRQELLKQQIEQERQHQIRQLQLQIQIEQLQQQTTQQQQNVAGPAAASSLASLFSQGLLGGGSLGGLGFTGSGFTGVLSSSSPAGGPVGAGNPVLPPLPGTATLAGTAAATTMLAPSPQDVKLAGSDGSRSSGAGGAANAAGGGLGTMKQPTAKKVVVKKTKSLKKKRRNVVKKT